MNAFAPIDGRPADADSSFRLVTPWRVANSVGALRPAERTLSRLEELLLELVGLELVELLVGCAQRCEGESDRLDCPPEPL